MHLLNGWLQVNITGKEFQLTTTSSTKKKVVGTIGSAPGTDAIIQPLAASSSAKAGFGASGGFQFGLSSSFKTTFGGTATAAAGLAAANQVSLLPSLRCSTVYKFEVRRKVFSVGRQLEGCMREMGRQKRLK